MIVPAGSSGSSGSSMIVPAGSSMIVPAGSSAIVPIGYSSESSLGSFAMSEITGGVKLKLASNYVIDSVIECFISDKLLITTASIAE